MNTENAVLLSSLISVNVRHDFSEVEQIQQSHLFAKTVKDCETEEANKKSDMSVYKNKIDRLKAEIKEISGKINNGYDFIDKAAELWLDYETNQRIYKSKEDGTVLKTEPFHQSDYQKKLDLDDVETARQQQIEENNATGDYAEAPIDAIIVAKKTGGKQKEKPTPADNLHPMHGKDQ